MKKTDTKTSSKFPVSERTRRAYEQRDKSLDRGDVPQLPPEAFYRPLKTAVSLRLDRDVIAWLKAQGTGYQTRLNSILCQAMEEDLAKSN